MCCRHRRRQWILNGAVVMMLFMFLVIPRTRTPPLTFGETFRSTFSAKANVQTLVPAMSLSTLFFSTSVHNTTLSQATSVLSSVHTTSLSPATCSFASLESVGQGLPKSWHWLCVGLISMTQQQYGRAREFFGRCANQTDDLNVQMRGLIQLAVVNLQFFARSIVINPDDQYCIYGRAQVSSGYFKSMERMISGNENLPAEHRNRRWDLLQSQIRSLEQEFRPAGPHHDQISVIAGFSLGVLWKIRRRWDKASRIFEQISNQTSNRMIQAHAKYELGLLSCNLEHLMQAALQKDDPRIQALAKLELGKMYRLGTCVKPDHFNASVFFQQVIDDAADLAVEAEALKELALMFVDGMYGFPKNYRKACSYFEKLVDQDHNPDVKHVALYKLGEIFEHGGWGVTKDMPKAKRFFQQSRYTKTWGIFRQIGLLFSKKHKFKFAVEK